jgi:hypothetical protein
MKMLKPPVSYSNSNSIFYLLWQLTFSLGNCTDAKFKSMQQLLVSTNIAFWSGSNLHTDINTAELSTGNL